MAINKVVNSWASSSAAMRNCGIYVLRQDKTEDDLTYMTGPAPDELTGSTVYKAFMDEKKLWHKEDGRLYSHNIISFHENEEITPQEELQFGIAYYDVRDKK